MMLSSTHSTHLFFSCANCLKKGIINGFRAACGEKKEKVKKKERKKKLIKLLFPIFLSVNQIMICWLFLLINCSTFPLICAQTNTTKWNFFPSCFFFVDYSTEQFSFRFILLSTLNSTQLNSTQCWRELRRMFFRFGEGNEKFIFQYNRQVKSCSHKERHSLPFHFISLSYGERAFCVIEEYLAANVSLLSYAQNVYCTMLMDFSYQTFMCGFVIVWLICQLKCFIDTKFTLFAYW